MALGDNYCTSAELKTRLGITDALEDAAIAAAVSTSSRNIEKYCRRQFNDSGAATARRYHALSYNVVLVDDFWNTTGLEVATDEDDDGDYETIWDADDDFLPYPLDRLRDGVDDWVYWNIKAVGVRQFANSRRPGVQVTARWGWEAVPASVKEATLALAEEVFKMKDSPYGIAGFGEFGFVRVRENPKIVSMLKDYRRKAIRVAS